jgi:GrpB-like predicted nucleotidyltransferase (UPF0157 family)
MTDAIEIVPYDPDWPNQFRVVADAIRREMGGLALRIDHVGSTSVPGLAAKDVIDLQISVADFEPLAPLVTSLQRAGFEYRADNPELTKRYFRERPGFKRIHVHVRRVGSFSEQLALLFRDHLRGSADDCALYAAEKRRLAGQFRHDRPGYTDAKAPVIWAILQRASDWSQRIGWQPGPTDA